MLWFFLRGLIDFLHDFQEWVAAIPVAVVIGLTLLFLVVTTILPTLHIFSLYINFTSSKSGPLRLAIPPSQCLFKSPQPHTTRRLLKPLFNLAHYLLHPSCSRDLRSLLLRMTHPFSPRPPVNWEIWDNLISYIYYSSVDYSWVDYDKDWLVICDGYMRP